MVLVENVFLGVTGFGFRTGSELASSASRFGLSSEFLQAFPSQKFNQYGIVVFDETRLAQSVIETQTLSLLG